jgi:hypothetical protein
MAKLEKKSRIKIKLSLQIKRKVKNDATAKFTFPYGGIINNVKTTSPFPPEAKRLN